MSTDFLDLSGVHSLGKQLLDARFPVLEGLSPIALKILNAATSELLVARGVDILRIGDTPSGLYFVDAGEVEIFRLVGGRLEKVDTLRAGDVFGEFGVLRGFARTALVRTASPCRLLRVEAEAVHQVLEGNAEFRARLESLMHSRMRQNFFAMHPVFAAANARLGEAFAEAATLKLYHRGDTLFEQGDAAEGFWFILSGTAAVYFRNRAGVDVLVDLRRVPDVLGEVMTKQKRTYAYAAKAAFELDAWFLPLEALTQLRQVDAEGAARLERYLQERALKTALRLKENLGVQP